MKHLFRLSLLLVLLQGVAQAADDPAQDLQHRFEARYQSYLTPASESLLPFPELELPVWKSLLVTGDLKPVFSRHQVFYNSKTYDFTMYRSGDGRYYLNAKGGFWGMDELVYGPIAAELLQ